MTQKEIEWLDVCLDCDHGMSGKELDYIEDLDNNWRDQPITDKQRSWLESIFDRAAR